MLHLPGGVRTVFGCLQTMLQDPTAAVPWQWFAWWQKLVAVLWAVCIIGAVVFLLQSIRQLRRATRNNLAEQAAEAKTSAVWAGSALLGLVGLGAILTTAFAIAS